MIVQRHNIMLNSRLEQVRLAMALVDSLGLEGAIFACRANGWDGVLDFLLGTEVRELTDAEPQPHHV